MSARSLKRQALAALTRVDREMQALIDDPMSLYAPISDFAETYERRARREQWGLLRRMKKAKVCGRMQTRIIEHLTRHV